MEFLEEEFSDDALSIQGRVKLIVDLSSFNKREKMIYNPIVLSILISFGLFFGYFIYIYCALCWKLRKFRGPPAFPLIGNCYTSQVLTFFKYLGKLRTQYGRIYTFFNFTKAFLVVCDPVVVRRVLSDSKTFPKGTDYTEKFAYSFGEGLVTSNGEKHKKDRSIFGKFFIRSSIAKFAQKVNEISDQVISLYIPEIDKPTVFNIEFLFARLALRSFMNFALSEDLSDQPKEEEKFCHLVSKGSNAVGRIIIFNLPMWNFLPDMKLLQKCNRRFAELFNYFLNIRKQKLAKGEMTEVDDCLSAMIKENLSEKEMVEHFATLISAGHDTTAFFLSYLVYLLAQNPQVQEKLYSHIMEKVGHKSDISVDDFAEMKYLQCVMMEVLRFYAIIPAVSRIATEDVHIKEANITIPEGTTVFIPMIIINRDPEIWDNPGEFRPSRFEEKGTDFTSAKDGFFPFGYGTRTCIGNTFAQVESAIVVCKLMKKYIFEPDPNFRIAIRAGISLTTSNGINVVLKPR
jgi:cytochrome P450